MATVEEQQQNPLVEGLERLPVHPTTLAIFGATGDLSKRKLLPAIYNLAHEGALPERFNLIGSSRSEMSDEEFRTLARESIAEFSRRRPTRRCSSALIEHMRYVPGSFDQDSRLRAARRLREGVGRGGGHPVQPRLLPVDRAVVLPGDRRQARRARPRQARGVGRARGDREADRHQPGRGARAEPRGARGAGRVAGLPDRPLPRQGDRAEHAGVPVRERDVRADLEPQLHRLRADHRGRGHRDRLARGLLRHLGRAARPGAEPHAPAAVPALHGAARELLGRRGARREGEGAARGASADARTRCRAWRCARSTRPACAAASR